MDWTHNFEETKQVTYEKLIGSATYLCLSQSQDLYIQCHMAMSSDERWLFVLLILVELLTITVYCIVCPSLTYGFWLPFWYLQMIIPLVSSNDYPIGIFKWLPHWYLQMITTLLSSNDYPIGIFKWLPLWYLQMITPLISSNDYLIGIFKWLPLWYLQMITSLVSSNDYSIGIFKLFLVFWEMFCRLLFVLLGFSIYDFWLPLWYLQTFLKLSFHKDDPVNGKHLLFENLRPW